MLLVAWNTGPMIGVNTAPPMIARTMSDAALRSFVV
jgi:hypothetical protein